MAVYIVTGNLGSGKSLVCMGRMREYLWKNNRVATNVNVRVENLVSGKAPRNILRIPDHPTAEFLWDGLGFGSESKDESTFGMLLMDEVGTWLNSREWKGNDRQRVIEWFIHSRKRRWDCYLVAQSLNMIDKQVREAIGEHVVVCKRFDRMGLPFLGWLFNILGFVITMPQLHVAAVRYCAGMSFNSAPTVDRWFYSGRDLYGSYDTAQRFSADNDGVATMLDPHKYEWLRDPKSRLLDLIKYCRTRNWHRLEAFLESLHVPSPQENAWRLLQLYDEYGDIVARSPSSFNDWLNKTPAWQQMLKEQDALFAPPVSERGGVDRGNGGFNLWDISFPRDNPSPQC